MRKGDGESPRPLDLPPLLLLPLVDLPFCTALYIISVQSTQPLDPLWLMDCSQRFSFWTWTANLICLQDFLIKSDYSLKYLMLSLMF